MTMTEHARHELELCGQQKEDPGYTASLVAAIAAFASYGHSGGSASVAIEQLQRHSGSFSHDGGKTFWVLETVPMPPGVGPVIEFKDGRNYYAATSSTA